MIKNIPSGMNDAPFPIGHKQTAASSQDILLFVSPSHLLFPSSSRRKAGGDDGMVEKYHTVRGTEKLNPIRYRNQITA